MYVCMYIPLELEYPPWTQADGIVRREQWMMYDGGASCTGMWAHKTLCRARTQDRSVGPLADALGCKGLLPGGSLPGWDGAMVQRGEVRAEAEEAPALGAVVQKEKRGGLEAPVRVIRSDGGADFEFRKIRLRSRETSVPGP